MKKAAVSVLLCLCLLFSCAGSALGVDTSRDNCQIERLRYSVIATLKTNRYEAGRAVIIFFPGGMECNRIDSVLRFVRGYELYDEVEADIIAVSFKFNALKPRDWEQPAQDVMEYLKERYEPGHFPIIVDALSFGGYGGWYMAKILNENGMPVKELNMADACLPRHVSADQLRETALSGTQVNAWGCYSSANVSKETRSIIDTLEGEGIPNFRGVLIQCSHGQVLSKAIHEYGLHSECK